MLCRLPPNSKTISTSWGARLAKAAVLGYKEPMKKEIHPANFRPVIFEDVTAGKRFLIASTIQTQKTDKWEDGKEYPVFEVEISSASHPFYTGQGRIVDTAGRVEKFKARVSAAKSKKETKHSKTSRQSEK